MRIFITIFLSIILSLNCMAQSRDRALAETKNALTAVLKEADAILKSPATLPLAPPKCEFSCNGQMSRINKLKTEQYYKEFIEPEGSVMNKLLTAERNYINLPNAQESNIGWKKAGLLSERLLKRVKLLLKDYGKNKDYYYPVVSVANRVATDNFHLTGNTSDVLSIICSNANEISYELLTKLKTEHDYSLAQQILAFGRTAANLGCGDDNALAKLMDALSFKITYENELEFPVDGEQPYKYKAEGTINCFADVNSGPLKIRGKNDVNIVFGQMNGTCGDPPRSCISNLSPPLPFPFEVVSLEFDMCDSSKGNQISIIGMSKFGPQNETWMLCSVPPEGACGSYQQSLPGVLGQAMLGYLFNDGYIYPKDYLVGGFHFEMPIKNKDVEAGKLEIVKALEGGGYYKILFTITHNPGK